MEELQVQDERRGADGRVELRKTKPGKIKLENSAGAVEDSSHVRVGTREREESVSRITSAAVAGYLDLDEAGERLERAWKARTAGELKELEADLPVEWLKELADAEATRSARAAALAKEQSEFRGGLRSYLLVMGVLVGVWLVAALTGGSWSFWPVWPMLGWGVAVLGSFMGVRAHQAELARAG